MSQRPAIIKAYLVDLVLIDQLIEQREEGIEEPHDLRGEGRSRGGRVSEEEGYQRRKGIRGGRVSEEEGYQSMGRSQDIDAKG